MQTTKINAILWILVFFIFNTKVVFSDENHDSEKHPLTSPVSCPQESDAEGRRYLAADMMPSEVMFNELRHNLPELKNLNNKQIMGMMKSMPSPNYYWTFDKKDPDQKTGALLLAHGYGEEGLPHHSHVPVTEHLFFDLDLSYQRSSNNWGRALISSSP